VMASGLATTSSSGTLARPGKIAATFAELRAKGKRAFVPYITAGDPGIEETVDLLKGLEDAGADVIEVGVPFSDPMADGPVIQASSQRALDRGVRLDAVLDMVSRSSVRAPIVLFSYLNPILAAGPDVLDRAAQAGCHGLLLTDLPVGSDPAREAWLGGGPLAFIRLVAPTTPAERMREIGTHGSGFVYLISRLGVTGVQQALAADLPESMARLRAATTLPICVGFGVSTAEQATAVAKLADGVVVGSAIVRAANESVASAVSFARDMRRAIDAA
ncbi:MAG TPA: tryptophan synthase subunit alpha, partial [Gemmatimonadaceae bacterium]|nr:tryptophan synthase subunit alpha [Gemmatimonadaceae bacterium]